MTDGVFDVAVIAEGLNALLAAYELAKSGASVALIDRYKPSLELDGYDFNYYPQHLFTPHDLPGIFQELRIAFEVYTGPAYQVVLPDRRIDMHLNIQRLMKAVGCRFADGTAQLGEFLSREQRISDLQSQIRGMGGGRKGRPGKKLRRLVLKERLLRESRYAYRALGGLNETGPESAFIDAIGKFMAPWLDGLRLPAYRAAAPLFLRKRVYPAGGRGGLKAALLSGLGKRRVSIIQGEEVSGIEHGRYFTTRCTHGQEVRSRRLVLDPIREKTVSLLPFRAYRGMRKRFFVDNIFIGLRRSCLPEPYSRVNSAVMVGDYGRPLENDNLIFMDTSPLTDIKRTRDEMVALTATLLIREDSVAGLPAIRQAAIDRIRWFMPFFDEHVERIYYTDPSIVWEPGTVPVSRKGLLLLNDEFINLYTGNATYAYIKRQAEKLVRTL